MIIQVLVISLLIFSLSNAYAEEFSRNLNESVKITESYETPEIIPITSQNADLTVKDMTIGEFKKLVNDSVAEISTSDYNRATLEIYAALSYTIIGGLLGFLGSLIIELIKSENAKQKIRELCLRDLLRLEKNLRSNYVICHEMIINRSERHNFLDGIRAVPDLENLENLAASQQFNFWPTIISSTQLIQLKYMEIGKLQTVYDLTMKYNSRIEYMVNGIPAHDVPYVIRGAKQILAEEIFILHNPLGAELALSSLSAGLRDVHQALYDIVINTIHLIDVKNRSNSPIYRLLSCFDKQLQENLSENLQIIVAMNEL